MARTNIQTDRQTNFKMPDNSNINNSTIKKTNLSNEKKKKNENLSTCSKVMAKHPFKKIMLDCMTFSSLKSVKNRLILQNNKTYSEFSF